MLSSPKGDSSSPLLPPQDCCTPSAHPPVSELPRASDAPPLAGTFQVLTPLLAQQSSFECYLSFPPNGRAKGVVILFTDIFGLHTGRHARMCDELAAAGYIAACPDLFGDGIARAQALTPSWPIKKLSNILTFLFCCKLGWMKKALKLSWESIGPKIQHTLSHVLSEHERLSSSAPALNGCAAVGLCWGASIVARLLSESEAVKLPLPIVGGIGFHPSLRGSEGEALVSAVARPFLICPAGDDPAPVQPGGARLESSFRISACMNRLYRPLALSRSTPPTASLMRSYLCLRITTDSHS